MTEEYKSNSYKSKEKEMVEDKKKVDKVVRGKVKTKKKSGVTKFTDVFISEDIANVKSYIVGEVLVPAMKKALSDIITNGIDMLLYGESGVSKRNSRSSKVSYTKYYNDERSPSRSVKSNYNYDDIIIDSRGEAEEVLTRMDELIYSYGMVSVADFYDLVGVTSRYTDNNYGWTDVRSARVVHVRDGYIIKLPRAVPLD